MKIRTITAGIKLSNPIKDSKVINIINFLKKARERFESFGSVVQSVRLSTQPWNEYTKRLDKEEIIENICQLENLCRENEIDFISIGTTNKLDSIYIIPETESWFSCIRIPYIRQPVEIIICILCLSPCFISPLYYIPCCIILILLIPVIIIRIGHLCQTI